MHWTFLVPLLWDAKKRDGEEDGFWKKEIVDFHSMLILMALIWICRLPTIQQEVQQRKLLYMGLYLLIWGEAANLRFMPECICYIYHHVCFKIITLLLPDLPSHWWETGNMVLDFCLPSSLTPSDKTSDSEKLWISRVTLVEIVQRRELPKWNRWILSHDNSPNALPPKRHTNECLTIFWTVCAITPYFRAFLCLEFHYRSATLYFHQLGLVHWLSSVTDAIIFAICRWHLSYMAC